MKPKRSRKRILWLVIFILLTTGLTIASIQGYRTLAQQLPSIQQLRDIRLQIPLRVYTRDHKLLAEFGEKKRTPVTYNELPPLLIKAFLAAEDSRFFIHPGVDYQGILRALFELIRTGEKRQGGSTITMQVARNFFLSREKTYLRKATEILLALRMERELSKQQILELYLNKIYLGHRSYGVIAAAQTYYNLPLKELDIAQMAMIAGLPKAPSSYNPVTNASRALLRRNYVLRRMHKLNYINDDVYDTALHTADEASLYRPSMEVDAPYIAEMVRAEMLKRYGSDTYTAGYTVYTTIDSQKQKAANMVVRKNLLEYEYRHGYRGPEAHIEWDRDSSKASLEKILKPWSNNAGLRPALVTEVNEKNIHVITREGQQQTIEWDGLSWARRYIKLNQRGNKPEQAGQIVQEGDIVLIENITSPTWKLSQTPKVEGALVSLRSDDGAIEALVGGFNFYRSKFNRVTQAQRQPGSSFKPILYSAALEKGFTPASIINDAPVVFDDPALESAWRPENYSGKFYGPTRMREALVRSRNLVSIRLLQAIGIRHTIQHAVKFGFNRKQLPRDLSLSLGSASVTPMEMARAYSVFSNGGFRIEPYLIDEIRDVRRNIIYQAQALLACAQCLINEDTSEGEKEHLLMRQAPTAISPQNAYQITSMLNDVIKRGTGRRARVLKRGDLSGKTGTTNDQRDAWFCGFNRELVTTTWVGFDQVQPLGNYETGSRAALPMWINYMRVALQDSAESTLDMPADMVTVRIDPKTGLLASSGQKDAIFETFRSAYVPRVSYDDRSINVDDNGDDDPLF
ncbi:MAG: penicillin-binding protein 1A [Gammaproteobacteria bacterium]|nr:penicillin-binding protein 1A [Gammaproteobacteria bacterium]